MRLIGATKIEELGPDMIDTRGLSMHTATVPVDTLSRSVYDPLVNPPESTPLPSKL